MRTRPRRTSSKGWTHSCVGPVWTSRSPSPTRSTRSARMPAGMPYGQNTQTCLSIRDDNLPSPVLWLAFPPGSGPYSPVIGTEEVEMERHMGWKTLLAYITGTVDQELLLRNEYLVTENRI